MKRDSTVYIFHFSIDFLYYLHLAFHIFFIIKPTRCTSRTRIEHPDAARKLSTNLYDIYHC